MRSTSPARVIDLAYLKISGFSPPDAIQKKIVNLSSQVAVNYCKGKSGSGHDLSVKMLAVHEFMVIERWYGGYVQEISMPSKSRS